MPLELEVIYKKTGLDFIGLFMETAIEFYRHSFKTYPEEIQLIAKLFDQIHDVNISVTEERFNGLKEIIRENKIVEALNTVILSEKTKKECPSAVEKAKETLHKIQNKMIPLLEMDPFYQPASEGMECFSMGTLNLNVTAILKAIEKNEISYDRGNINCDAYFWENCKLSQIDVEYAMQTDLSKPLLFIEISEDKNICIDGQHRMYHAYQEGIKELPVYLLHMQDYLPYFKDKRSYELFVKYWNRSLFKF